MLDFPGTDTGRKTNDCCRVRLASHRRRKAEGALDELEPLLHHATVGMLSEPHQMWLWLSGCVDARTAEPIISAASSKSLFVSLPVVLEALTNCWLIEAGKRLRKTMAGFSGSDVDTQNPPKPEPLASTDPMYSGGAGTRERVGVGVEARLWAKDIQS